MRTTLDLPDDLMRSVKVLAAREDKRLKETVAELLRLGLRSRGELSGAGAGAVGEPAPKAVFRVKLPIIAPGSGGGGFELTPERQNELEMEAELESHRASLRQ